MPSVKKSGKRTPWEAWYLYAAEYYNTHGDLLIPSEYITPDGVKLGRWINRQRAAYQGKRSYVINADQIEKLNAIRMVWKLEHRDTWENWYRAAKRYKLIYGNLDVPIEYTEGEMCLGNWISEQRKKYRSGKLDKEKTAKLENLGIKWNIIICFPWEKWYAYAVVYRREKGDLAVPFHYITPDGCRLGQWIYTQREKYNTVRRGLLTDEQIKLLNGINMIWDILSYRRKRWLEMYSFVADYAEKHGRLPKSRTVKSPDGKSAGYWIIAQKNRLSGENKIKIPEYQKTLLEKIKISPWKTKRQKPSSVRYYTINPPGRLT
ncbi:MAG: helicase associated domain-containing protein [Eubacteriales bacterium]|nr:helicase associated domain-containing protein [Eubacteriales bacterium]